MASVRAWLLAFSVLAVPFAVRAAPSCHGLSATALSFPSYDVYATAAVTSSGTISYSCPPPAVPTVTIGYGLHASGTQRGMLGPSGDLLLYQLCQDAACTTPWGLTPVSVPAGNTRSVPFYARVFAQQDVSVGSYSDTLTVTFNF